MVLAAALGTRGALADHYNVGNVMPNIIYELLLGGILTSIVVPLLVRSAREDGDEGTAFAQSLLTMVVVVLSVLTVVSVLAAPLLLQVYKQHGDPTAQEILFTRLFLPQIVFYGVGATVGAILNTRGRFGPPMFTPVLNNVVVIATGLLFILVAGADRGDAATVTGGEIALLTVGTTLGVVMMTLALLPALRSTGFRWRWRWDWRNPRLRAASRLGGWVLLYVAVNQVGFAVVVRLAREVGDRFTTYLYAFQLFQLPHAIVTVSVISALLPRMSRHADAGRLGDLGAELSTGLRLSLSLVVPAVAAYLVLAKPISVALFARGLTSEGDAALLGRVLMGFTVGLVFFTAFQLQLRGFYAMHDSRTPALINIAVNATMVVVDVLLFRLLEGDARLVGLATGYAASYAVGLVVSTTVLRRRVGGIGGRAVGRVLAKVLVASAVAAAPAYAASRAVQAEAGTTTGGSALAALAGLAVLGAGYLFVAGRLRVAELAELTGLVGARLRR
jgi:putative peptidoglycan lipid II flippase